MAKTNQLPPPPPKGWKPGDPVKQGATATGQRPLPPPPPKDWKPGGVTATGQAPIPANGPSGNPAISPNLPFGAAPSASGSPLPSAPAPTVSGSPMPAVPSGSVSGRTPMGQPAPTSDAVQGRMSVGRVRQSEAPQEAAPSWDAPPSKPIPGLASEARLYAPGEGPGSKLYDAEATNRYDTKYAGMTKDQLEVSKLETTKGYQNIENHAKTINQQVEAFKAEGQRIESLLPNLPPEEAESLVNTYNSQATAFNKTIEDRMALLEDMERNLDLDMKMSALREYDILKSTGSAGGVAILSLAKGWGKLEASVQSLAIDLEAALFFDDKGPINRETYRKVAKEQILPRARNREANAWRSMGVDTTDEYYNDVRDNGNILARAGITLGESAAPLMFAPIPVVGPYAAGVGFGLQAADSVEEEFMSHPDYKNIPESEIAAMRGILGTAAATLGKAGLTNMVRNSPMFKGFVAQALAKVPNGATPGQIQRILDGETRSWVANMGVRMAGGMVAEGETEAIEQVVDMTAKHLYNMMKERDILQTPEDMADAFAQTTEAFVMGAIAAAPLSAPQAISGAMRTGTVTKNMNDRQFAMFEKLLRDPTYLRTLDAYHAQQVGAGKMTKAEQQKLSDDMKVATEVLEAIPGDITPDARREAFDLVLEKRKLSSQDKVLSSPRIEAIDRRLDVLAQERAATTSNEAVAEEAQESTPVAEATEVSEVVEPTEQVDVAQAEQVPVEAVQEVEEEPVQEQPQQDQQPVAEEQEVTEEVVPEPSPESDKPFVTKNGRYEVTMDEKGRFHLKDLKPDDVPKRKTGRVRKPNSTYRAKSAEALDREAYRKRRREAIKEYTDAHGIERKKQPNKGRDNGEIVASALNKAAQVSPEELGPEGLVLQWLAGGNKINLGPNTPVPVRTNKSRSHLGWGNPDVPGWRRSTEEKLANGILNEHTGLTLEEAAHTIWSDLDPETRPDTGIILEALIDAIRSGIGNKTEAAILLDSHVSKSDGSLDDQVETPEQKQKRLEDEYYEELNELAAEIERDAEVSSFLDHLTDEQIEEYVNDYEQSLIENEQGDRRQEDGGTGAVVTGEGDTGSVSMAEGRTDDSQGGVSSRAATATAEGPVRAEDGDGPRVQEEGGSEKEQAQDPKQSLADYIRSKKVDTRGTVGALGNPGILINIGLEAAARAVEAGVAIKDALAQGYQAIKDSDWFKNEASAAEKKSARERWKRVAADIEKGTPSVSRRRLANTTDPATAREAEAVMKNHLAQENPSQNDVANDVNAAIDSAMQAGATLAALEQMVENDQVVHPVYRAYARGRVHAEASADARNGDLTMDQRDEASDLAARMVIRMANYASETGSTNAMLNRVYKDFGLMDLEVAADKKTKQANEQLDTEISEDGTTLREELDDIRKKLKDEIAKNEDLKKAADIIKQANEVNSEATTDRARVTGKPQGDPQTNFLEVIEDPNKLLKTINELKKALEQARNEAKQQKKKAAKLEKDAGNLEAEADIQKQLAQKAEIDANKKADKIAKLIEKVQALKDELRKRKKDYKKALHEYEKQVQELIDRNIVSGTKKGVLTSGNMQQRLKQALLNAALVGRLNEEFWNNMAEALGIPVPSQAMRDVMQALSNAVLAHQKKGQRELAMRAQRALNTQLRKLTPADAEFYYSLFGEVLHTNVLTGIGTMFSANLGSVYELGTAWVSLTARKIKNPAAVAYAFGRMFQRGGLRLGANKARNFTMAYDDLGNYLEGDSRNGMGAYEEFLKMGLAQGIQQAKDGDVKNGVAKAIGAALAMPVNTAYAIRAIDAFATHSFAEFRHAIHEFENSAKELGVKNTSGAIGAVLSKLDFPRVARMLKQDTLEYQKALKEAQSEVDEMSQLDPSFGKYQMVGSESAAKKWREAYVKRRAGEIVENGRAAGDQMMAMEMAKDAILMGEPDGLSGSLYRRIRGWKSAKSFREAGVATKVAMVASYPMTMFTRITANTWSRVYHNTPIIGLLGSVYGYDSDGGITNQYKRNPERAKNRIASNLIVSTITYAMLSNMFDLEEPEEGDEAARIFGMKLRYKPDRLVDITADAYGDYGQNQNINEDYQTFSIRFRSPDQAKKGEWGTPWMSLRLNTSFAAMFGAIGRLADDAKGWSPDGKKTGDVLGRIAANEGVKEASKWTKAHWGIMGESTFNMMAQTYKRLQRSEDEVDLSGIMLQDFLFSPAQSLAQPAIYRDLINEAAYMQGLPAKQRNRVAGPADAGINFAGGMYGLDMTLFSDRTDRWGNPKPRTEKFSDNVKGIVGINSMTELYPEVRLQFKYEDTKMPTANYRPKSIVLTDDLMTLLGKSKYPKGVDPKDRTLKTDPKEREQIDLEAKQFFRWMVRSSMRPPGHTGPGTFIEDLDQKNLEKAFKDFSSKSKNWANVQYVRRRLDDENSQALSEAANQFSAEFLEKWQKEQKK